MSGIVFFAGFLSSAEAKDLTDINFSYICQNNNIYGLEECRPIDECLLRKEYHFNEIYNMWVDNLVRCKVNTKGVLSTATYSDATNGSIISEDTVEEQKCAGRREGEILKNGDPSKDAALYWSGHCSYLGTIGGVGPPGPKKVDGDTTGGGGGGTPSAPNVGNGGGTGTTQMTKDQAKEALKGILKTDPTDDQVNTFLNQIKGFTPVFQGLGVSVPSSDLVAKGISKEKNLIKLLVFYTNATLPFVSVVAVFVFVAAGLYYIFSFVDESLKDKAKTMMTYVVIGIIIIFSAYTIVNTLLRLSEFSQ